MFNQTEITIRQRGRREIFDLALHVARRHAGALLVAQLLGAIPFALFNAWTLSRLRWDADLDSPSVVYLSQITLLVFVEGPLAGSLMTLYLGHMLFRAQPTWRQLFVDFRKMLPQLLWYQGVIRGVFVAMLIAALNRPTTFRTDRAVNFLWFVAVIVLLIRSIRPYLSEVILLERNPYSKQRAGMTTARRNSALHASYGGDCLAHMIAAGIFGGLGIVSVWYTLMYLRLEFLNAPPSDRFVYTVLYPIAVWSIVWFLTVVRFLGYLDLRIRREGWEVELRIRAEAAALTS
jgi:hypothetical protein